MENNLPKRKTMRWGDFNYDTPCMVFVTICTKERKALLSDIVLSQKNNTPMVQLTPTGKIIEEQILQSEKSANVNVAKYVIMPDHIHVIFYIKETSCNATTRQNEIIPRLISTFKRFCTKKIGENIFQRSYYDHVIRDSDDFDRRANYIDENPAKWYYSEK